MPGQWLDAKSSSRIEDFFSYYQRELENKGYRQENLWIPEHQVALDGRAGDGPGVSMLGFVNYSQGNVRGLVLIEENLNPAGADQKLPPNYRPGPFRYSIFVSEVEPLGPLISDNSGAAASH